jgi:hypothetical protein
MKGVDNMSPYITTSHNGHSKKHAHGIYMLATVVHKVLLHHGVSRCIKRYKSFVYYYITIYYNEFIKY